MILNRLINSGLLGVTAILALQTRADVETWPQWRGPNRDGQVLKHSWPDKLTSNHLQRSWSVELGQSYSGPIVGPTLVYTTETINKKTEVASAFDRKTGNQVWRTEWEGSISVPFFAKSNGDWIRATPALDNDRIYVAGMRDVLVCLDSGTGKEIWRKDFVKELAAPLPDFGFVSSPLVDGDSLYVQAGASFVRLNKTTGQIIWRTLKDEGGMWGSVFSSPAIMTLAGERQLVVQTRHKLAGVQPTDGKVLWEQPVEAFRGMNILTPVAVGDTLFTSTYGGRTVGFKVTHSDGKWTIAEAWRHKAQGYMSTPVIIDGVAYNHLKSQRVMAIEVETGRELWVSNESFGKYWSLVANGNQILALDQRGILISLTANKEKLDILDRRKIADSETWAHLAVAGDQLFVRELHALTAWQWLPETASLK